MYMHVGLLSDVNHCIKPITNDGSLIAISKCISICHI